MMKSLDGILWKLQRLFRILMGCIVYGKGKIVRHNRFKMVRVFIYLFALLRLALCLYIDAMAYRGDLIGCTIKFESEEDGKVPVVFRLNGRRITEDEIWIDYTPREKLMYPYIGMGHHGIRVLAKVCTIDSVYYEQFILINFGTVTAPLCRYIFLPYWGTYQLPIDIGVIVVFIAC